MSCNGCRVLRKGCSESCILRPCLQWIETAEAQGHATVFVAKFFGRAGLMSFISAVPESRRPALFRSLIYEACGRTVNPVSGAVGLLSMGNWHVCESAVQTVLRGGTLRPLPEDSDLASEISAAKLYGHGKTWKRKKSGSCSDDEDHSGTGLPDLDLSLSSAFQSCSPEKRLRRPGTPSETSVMTSAESRDSVVSLGEPRLLNLLV